MTLIRGLTGRPINRPPQHSATTTADGTPTSRPRRHQRRRTRAPLPTQAPVTRKFSLPPTPLSKTSGTLPPCQRYVAGGDSLFGRQSNGTPQPPHTQTSTPHTTNSTMAVPRRRLTPACRWPSPAHATRNGRRNAKAQCTRPRQQRSDIKVAKRRDVRARTLRPTARSVPACATRALRSSTDAGRPATLPGWVAQDRGGDYLPGDQRHTPPTPHMHTHMPVHHLFIA